MSSPQCDIAGELLRAVALAWHELGTGCPIRASVAHEYLGQILRWAIAAAQPDPVMPEAHALIANPDLSDDEIAESEAREAIAAYLSG